MLKRMISLIMMILLVIPAAYATGAAANDEDLLSALDAANSTEQLFERHTSQYRHECIYSRGELLVEIDRYYDMEHVYFIFGKEYSCYITPTGFIQYWADNGALEMLMMPPEEYPEKLESYQSYFYFDETEALDSVQEQDGELLVTTEKEDADDIRAYLEVMKVAYGDEFETEYGEGAKLISVYHVDAESLEIKECTETMRLADGSEVPLTKITASFDVEIPDPAAPDNSLAPAFDEAAERRTITVVFASGTPEEQTCVFTIPEGIDGYVQYHGEYMDLYEDPECTQPFTGRNGRTEFTVYTKGSEEE